MRPTPAQHFSPSSFLYAQQTLISTTPPFALLLVIPEGNLLLLLPLSVPSVILSASFEREESRHSLPNPNHSPLSPHNLNRHSPSIRSFNDAPK
jgi:hypothetical protein